jgi:uncharacterized protein YbbK (DUF523 family)
VRKILVSACLLGRPVRYDGRALGVSQGILANWLEEGRVISVCPEVDAGMSIPRSPAEIIQGNGTDVLASTARVVDSAGRDVTSFFQRGAGIALSLCREHNVALAILTQSSPSCGSSNIYDGTFSRNKIAGVGVTTALLVANAIPVFSQHQIAAAQEVLRQLES